MSVWLTIPSAKPKAEAQACVDLWTSQDYKVALWRDQADGVVCDLQIAQPYPGYAVACNSLIHEVMGFYEEEDARWFICAGDDMEPDRTKRADVIAAECLAHFGGTYGVMQPTGDGYGASTIAGSAWFGREWCERMYGGKGPFWHEYTHCFLDNEAMEVAKLTGTFWQRPDLAQKHNHWGRIGKPMPHYLAEANSPGHWKRFQRLFEYRKSVGFPGHEVSA